MEPAAHEGPAARTDRRPPIHATNQWNPTGHNLLPVSGCRLYYAHAETLSGPRTLVFLGGQQHLTFVADLDGYRPPGELRDTVLGESRLYPHLVDLDPAPGLPRLFADQGNQP
jgi:hypothetical protein